MSRSLRERIDARLAFCSFDGAAAISRKVHGVMAQPRGQLLTLLLPIRLRRSAQRRQPIHHFCTQRSVAQSPAWHTELLCCA
jgi:hypothetical protein